MKRLPTLAAYALMAPAITLGIGSAFATEPPAGHQAAKDQRTTQEQRQMPGQSQKDKGMSTADRAQEHRMAADHAKRHGKAHETYLSSAPANSFRADDLIGSELKSRSGDETLGTVSDLVIDEDGKIAAVVLETGSTLGLGGKDVAISWDSIERRSNDDRDGYDFSVDATKDSLEDAPEYKTESRNY